jgi:hypothetical protein
MSEITYKEVVLDEIIDFTKAITNGSWFTKTLINDNKGNIPVYGASLEENEASYGFVKDNLTVIKNNKTRKVKYFENCLTWNIDGSVAIFYRKNRFSLSEKVIPLLLLKNREKDIDLNYLKIVISESSKKEGFHFSNKAGKKKLRQLLVKIPFNKKKQEFDLKTQNEMVTIYDAMENNKKILKEKLNYMNEIYVDFLKEEITEFKKFKINELFELYLGDGKYTKEYSVNNEGKYPLYSGKTEGAYAYINEYDYVGKYLTWSKDGLAGYLMYHNGEKFSITNHRGIMILKEKFNNIDLRYIKIILEPIFRKYKKGRMATGEKNEYTTLSKGMIKRINEDIFIPVNKNGKLDLEKQIDIVSKYETIRTIKNEINNKAEELLNVEIEFN